jgi:hypothetical protein
LNFDLPAFGLALRVVDSVTNAPVPAHIDKRVELTGGTQMTETTETDGQGRFVVGGLSEGTARLHISAKKYRAVDIAIPLRADSPETIVRLEPGRELAGRVIDENGTPVPGVRVTGGYPDETTTQAYFRAITDGNGHFHFESAPDAGTTFYAAAPRHALAIATLEPGRENTIVMHSPNASVVSLIADNAPLRGQQLIMAAPRGGSLIPLAAFEDLAEVNGMSSYQLLGCGKDGVVILQEFLQPGAYDLFVAEPGGNPFTYRRAGTVRVPADREVVLSYTTK